MGGRDGRDGRDGRANGQRLYGRGGRDGGARSGRSNDGRHNVSGSRGSGAPNGGRGARGGGNSANSRTRLLIERRLEARAKNDERKRVADSKAEAYRAEKACRAAEAAAFGGRNIAAEAARGSVVGLEDSARASFRFHASDDTLKLRNE